MLAGFVKLRVTTKAVPDVVPPDAAFRTFPAREVLEKSGPGLFLSTFTRNLDVPAVVGTNIKKQHPGLDAVSSGLSRLSISRLNNFLVIMEMKK